MSGKQNLKKCQIENKITFLPNKNNKNKNKSMIWNLKFENVSNFFFLEIQPGAPFSEFAAAEAEGNCYQTYPSLSGFYFCNT